MAIPGHKFPQLLVVTLRVKSENLGRVDRQGTVHENGQVGQFVRACQPMQTVDKFLRAAHREGRDHDLPAMGIRLTDQVKQPLFGILVGQM